MLKQKQAKLLDNLFLLVGKHKSISVAEELLQLLLEKGAVTRPLINNYISSYLGTDMYVIKHLVGKTEDTWITALDEFVMDTLIKKYEEVLTWALIEKKL